MVTALRACRARPHILKKFVPRAHRFTMNVISQQKALEGEGVPSDYSRAEARGRAGHALGARSVRATGWDV